MEEKGLIKAICLSFLIHTGVAGAIMLLGVDKWHRQTPLSTIESFSGRD
ncbi:MAG: hypothetical protein AB1422_07305 [bacterium]